ncbi:MAG: DUF5995 family protein [Opitutaceae bacterium]|jgi:hypothetical protein
MRPSNPPPPFAAAATVPDVIQAMVGFVAWCEANASRLGYFAALYLRITKAVEAALGQGTVFQDNERMAQLDATFANRYFTALNGYFHPEQFPGISGCWLAAFTGTETPGDTAVQYILTGVASHIGLDLGIATQQVCGTPSVLQQFQGDFDQINTVLAQQVQTVLGEIDSVSPLLADLYAALGKHEMALIDDGLGGSRAAAWAVANALAVQQPAQQALTIAAQDALVAGLIPIVSSPPEPLGAVAKIIAQHENPNIVQVIADLVP